MNALPSLAIKNLALEVLYASCLPQGIAAAADPTDNYRRIWTRDGIITGLAGVLLDDVRIIDHFVKTVLYLGEFQDRTGIIPSNVGVEARPTVSYGSTAGRVDATAWWVIGALLLMREYPDRIEDVRSLESRVLRAMEVLEIWEMNLGHLIYTPLGGNWADEYLVQGHTLYDNLLRLWGLQLASVVIKDTKWGVKALKVKGKIEQNFMYEPHPEMPRYHRDAYARIERDPGYLFAAIGPAGYDTRWDLAGNALGLLMGFIQKADQTETYINSLMQSLPGQLIPAFWPVVCPGEPEWELLKNNYNFRFKNKPHHFHNGGSWPVFSGLMAMAMASIDKTDTALKIHRSMTEALGREEPAYRFFEYFDTQNGQGHGVSQICYSASGWLFSDIAANGTMKTLKHLFE